MTPAPLQHAAPPRPTPASSPGATASRGAAPLQCFRLFAGSHLVASAHNFTADLE